VVLAAFRIVSAASLSAALSLPAFVYFTQAPGLEGSREVLVFSVVIAVAVVLTHRANIARLFQGEEKRLNRSGRTEK
jgi:glycerol-3-phosphate acyltransferase PlsY